MAAKTASLSVNVIADASKAKAAFKQAEDAAGSMSKQMQTVAKTIATAFVTDKFVDFAKGSIKAASDLGESINAVNVTFGKSADGILKFGETASKTVGMSAAQFNSFAVSFSGFTQQIAGATGDVTKVTTDLTKRIADFASVMNLDIKEAAQVFQSSLAGQTEPIRKFGIDMSAAAVEAFALKNGLASSSAEMTEGIKVQARYGLLMESTAKTAGDFANTSDSLANQQRILAAEFENVKVKIGEALIPSLQNVLGAIGPVFNAFNSLPDSIQQTVAQMGFMLGATALLKRNLENLGIASGRVDTAIKGLRFAFAGLIIADGIGNLLNEVSDASGNLDRKLQALQISLGDVESAANKSTDPLQAFRDLVAAEGKKFNLGNIVSDIGKEIKIVGGSIGRDIEYIDKAFDKLAGSSTEMAQKLLDSWALQNAALDTNSQQYKDNQMLIERYQERLDLATGSEKAMSNALMENTGDLGRSAKATDVLTASMSKMGAQALVSSTFVDGLTAEWQSFLGLLDKKDAFENAEDAIKDYEETFQLAAKGNKEAQEQVNEKLRQGQREIARAMELADLIPASQAKKILFLTDTGKLSEALALLKTVDSWYMRVQDRANITPSGMGSGRGGVYVDGVYIPPGLDFSGFMADGGLVNRASLAVIGEAGPEAVIPLTNPARALELMQASGLDMLATPASIPTKIVSGGGDTYINIQVEAGLVSSPDQVGQQIIEAIRRAERRSGKAFVAA